MKKRSNTLKTIILLFAWTLLLVVIPFFAWMIDDNSFKNNGSYISSEFEIVNYNVVKPDEGKIATFNIVLDGIHAYKGY